MNEMIPASEFKAHLAEYSMKVLPLLIVAHIAAILVFYFIIKKKSVSNKFISSTLAYLWLLDGIVHQWILGTFKLEQKITIVLLFSIQGILFLLLGVIKPKLDFKFEPGTFAILGFFFMIYGLVLYPVLGYLTGFGFPNGPVVGLICPSTIFTFGVLMFTDSKLPKFLIIIPMIWAIWGGLLAIIGWHVWGDIGLVSAGVICSLLLFTRKR